MASLQPVFCAEVPTDTYYLRLVEDPNGTPTNHDLTISVTSERYWIADAAISQSIWKILLDALTAAMGGTFSIAGQGASDATGHTIRLTHNTTDFKLDVTNTVSQPKLPLEWFGWASGDDPESVSGVLDTTQQPSYTWWPKAMFNLDRAQPVDRQIFTSGLTADGSEHAVSHDDGTTRYWRTFMSGSGILRGRLSQTDLNDQIDNWATDIGSGFSAPNVPSWYALDGDEGWWAQTVACTKKWIFLRHDDDLTSVEGEYRFSRDPSQPIRMDGWSRLSTIQDRQSAGGLGDISFSAYRIGGAPT